MQEERRAIFEELAERLESKRLERSGSVRPLSSSLQRRTVVIGLTSIAFIGVAGLAAFINSGAPQKQYNESATVSTDAVPTEASARKHREGGRAAVSGHKTRNRPANTWVGD